MKRTSNAVRLRRRTALLAGVGVLAAPMVARSQLRWKPDRPITVYNPLAVGGVCDVHLRFLGERVAAKLGQPVLVEARGGAGATLAAAQMINVKPDGHTLACMTINSLRYPHYQQTAWNPLKDFAYIIGLSEFTFGIVCKSTSPWRSIEDLVADGKKNPDKLNFGTSGIGGTGHLLMIEVEQSTGAAFTHVPFKGGPEWMQAMLGGHIQFVADGAQWAPFVETGEVRVLAMATPTRFPKYPDVPNLLERKIDAVAVSPYGLVGPAALPPVVVETLHDVYKEAMADPGHQKLLDQYIQVPWYRGPAEYRAFAEKYFVEVKPMLVKSGLAKA
ncbi:MAG: tripartite tricarboxylate transporter substrate binding protein [Reyranellaceae bacterium]